MLHCGHVLWSIKWYFFRCAFSPLSPIHILDKCIHLCYLINMVCKFVSQLFRGFRVNLSIFLVLWYWSITLFLKYPNYGVTRSFAIDQSCNRKLYWENTNMVESEKSQNVGLEHQIQQINVSSRDGPALINGMCRNFWKNWHWQTVVLNKAWEGCRDTLTGGSSKL